MIKFESVSYNYQGGEETALADVSFDLKPGSFHFLCGPSGAGKTTLFKMLYMDIMPTSGKLTVFGKDVSTLSRNEIADLRRRMGLVFQESRLLNHLTVRENVALPLSLHGKPTVDQEKSVDEILDWVGLSDKKHKHPEKLSGGERQRVSIARAVVNRPKILIADEPTGNVDAAMGKRIMHLFGELNRHGTTVLVVTHDKTLFKVFNSPCLHLENGRLIKQVQANAS